MVEPKENTSFIYQNSGFSRLNSSPPGPRPQFILLPLAVKDILKYHGCSSTYSTSNITAFRLLLHLSRKDFISLHFRGKNQVSPSSSSRPWSSAPQIKFAWTCLVLQCCLAGMFVLLVRYDDSADPTANHHGQKTAGRERHHEKEEAEKRYPRMQTN